MSKDEQDLISLLRNLDEDAALALVGRQLAAGEDPLRIMEECQEGMRQVGLLYEEQRYFISGLIMAGEILRQVVDLLEPVLEQAPEREVRGTVLLGTVAGDIHDIGKNVMHMLLRCNGFEVMDLGVDVPPSTFADRAATIHPDIIGLSGLLTTAIDAMGETIALLRTQAGADEPAPPILIGGRMVDENVHRSVGADFWASDAARGLALCRQIVTNAHRGRS